MYTQSAKIASDHHGCVPPIDSSRLKRANRGRDDPDDPAVGSAAEEREPGGELDHADDDRDPPPRVETREHVLRAIEEMSVAHRSDAVDDVERARDQQQNRDAQRPAHTSHMRFPLSRGPPSPTAA
jgi:hypothetical protein